MTVYRLALKHYLTLKHYFSLGLKAFVAILLFATQGASGAFFSIADGDWHQHIWSKVSHTDPSCTCGPSCNFNKDAYLIHDVTVTPNSCSPFKMSGGGEIWLSDSITLTIDVPYFEMSGGSYIHIPPQCTLIVNGEFRISSSEIRVDGHIEINGDLDMSSSTICGVGTGLLNGTLSGGDIWCFWILPVELVDFTAEVHQGNSILEWTTLTEVNSDHFEIHRMHEHEDGFTIVGSLPAANNSSEARHYRFVDELKGVPDGFIYYKLVKSNIGGYNYPSATISVRYYGLRSESLVITPNPASRRLTLRSGMLVPGGSVILISDLTGKEILSWKLDRNLEAGVLWSADLPGSITPGLYNVVLIGPVGPLSGTLVIH